MHRKILIAGGSGFLGRQITEHLLTLGDEVAWLVRRRPPSPMPVRLFLWNPAIHQIDNEAITWTDNVINLAGESIGETRWTLEGKTRIQNSRTEAVHTLRLALQNRSNPIKSFVGVSGIGYYGPSNIPKKESDSAGLDFPAKVAKAWEDAYSLITPEMSMKKSIIRLAPVLSVQTGALPPLLKLIKTGLGAVIGSGNQPFSWMHTQDVVRLFAEALEWNTTVNAAAPEWLTNEQITKEIALQIGRPIWLPPVPAFVLKIMLGERSELVTHGTIADLSHLNNTGFRPQFPTFREALGDLLARGI